MQTTFPRNAFEILQHKMMSCEIHVKFCLLNTIIIQNNYKGIRYKNFINVGPFLVCSLKIHSIYNNKIGFVKQHRHQALRVANSF